jgi:hypothetical protein
MNVRSELLIAALAIVIAGGVIGEGSARPNASRFSQRTATPKPRQDLPALGTRLTTLPDGAGKPLAEAWCLPCHASDIIRQQRLTKQQWTATVTKMVNWGAGVPEDQKDMLLDYLATQFGPDANTFAPVVARPNGPPARRR